MSLAGLEEFSVFNDRHSGQSIWRPTRPKLMRTNNGVEYTWWHLVAFAGAWGLTVGAVVLSYATRR